MGLLTLILASRILGPDEFGVFSIASAVMGIAYTLSDFGLSGGTVRHAAPFCGKSDQMLALVLASSLNIRLWIGTVALACGASVAWLIASVVIGSSAQYPVIILAFVGGFATSLYAQVRVTLQVQRRFKALATTRIAVTGGTLALVAGFAAVDVLSPESGILGYAVTPAVAFILFGLIVRDGPAKEIEDRQCRKNIFDFSKWVFAVGILSAVFMRLDVFFLGATWSASDVGIYSVALTLLFPATQLPNSLATVLMPDVSSFTSKLAIRRYMIDSLKYTVPISIALIAFALTPGPGVIVHAFFGRDYGSSVDPLRVLLGSASVILICTPFYLSLYPMGRPSILAAGDAIKLVLHAGIYAALVPTFGIMGAAWGNLMAMSAGSAIAVALVLREYSLLTDDRLRKEAIETGNRVQ